MYYLGNETWVSLSKAFVALLFLPVLGMCSLDILTPYFLLVNVYFMIVPGGGVCSESWC